MSKLNLVSLFQMCSLARKRSDLRFHSFPTPNLSTDVDSSAMSKLSPTIFSTTVWPSSCQPSFCGSLQPRAFSLGPLPSSFSWVPLNRALRWCFQDLSHSTPLFCCKFPVASHLIWNKSQMACRLASSGPRGLWLQHHHSPRFTPPWGHWSLLHAKVPPIPP